MFKDAQVRLIAAAGFAGVDGVPAAFDGRRIELDGQTYTELGAAAPGARWDVVLTYANSSGLCPLSCSYVTEHLTFRPDGTFMRSSVSSGTGPGDRCPI